MIDLETRGVILKELFSDSLGYAVIFKTAKDRRNFLEIAQSSQELLEALTQSAIVLGELDNHPDLAVRAEILEVLKVAHLAIAKARKV